VKSEIVGLIRSLGPIVPAEISSKLKVNSVIVSALLSELIREKVIKYSHKKVGSSPLYYIAGQEDRVRKRLLPELKIPERKIVEFFEENKLALRDGLAPQQRFMVDELEDFITKITLTINGEEKIFYKNYSVSEQELLKDMKNMKSLKKGKVKEAVPQQKLFDSTADKKSGKKKEAVACLNFDNASDAFFRNYELIVLECEKVRKGSEANFIARNNKGIGQDYFVKYYKKKNLAEKDINKAYAESLGAKKPCLIITTGKVNSKCEKLLADLGSYVKLIKIK